jgi:NAD(P)-dependent dehydrogenase (short-subunit alcohol dehydrogenase family)
MNRDFGGRSAVVTGGAGGLGGATARRLTELGMGVVILEPDGGRAEAFAAELGANAVGLAGDHGDEAAVLRAISAAQQMGVFSVNVNAAGVALSAPSVATAEGAAHSMSLFREMLELHLFGPFNVSRLCAAAFASNPPDADGQRGIIVNTASTAAFDGQAGQTAYAAAKSAIVGMTLSMARDLAEIGVRALAIAPGPIWTPRLAAAPEALLNALIANVAFPKRFGQSEEFASLVEAFLRTPFLNGQTIRLDGAMSTPLASMGAGARK